ncbi:MAG TPA: HAD-IIIC family phosphatase, partial [bacterium]|nr:HAD-IIIC family phosphatase [bacterium]
MYQTEWASNPPDGGLQGPAEPSALDPTAVDRAAMLIWMEHCVECAVPDCYAVCPLYVKRADEKCARFQYGIFPNRHFKGLLDYGAEIYFRRWGKLQSKLGFGATDLATLRRVAGWDTAAVGLINPVSSALKAVSPKRRLNGAWNRLREGSLRSRWQDDNRAFDEFVAEVFHPGPEPAGLIVECVQGRITFRESLALQPGMNLFRIPFDALGIDPSRSEGHIMVYPDNDAELRLVFTWLDFVRYKPSAVQSAGANRIPREDQSAAADHPPQEQPVPAKKVKCVVFDLDNTLWQGILVEDGPEKLVPRQEAIDLIHRLDERGIICSVVSKNDHGPAMEVITKLGLQDHFISPAINWGQKSRNLKAIADELNINIDTFAVIDDSPFERSEIGETWPQVRIFPETDLLALLDRPEFDVPVTEESRERRLSYLAEGKRKEIAQSYGDDYDAFLRSCGMEAHLFRPDAPAAIERCLELIQRSNQLNLSTRRYERDEFAALLADPDILPVALACKDRFGDYGTVGFAAVRMGDEVPVLQDLVISCRVAKKKVENAWFQWIADALKARGADRMHAHYKPTPRNGVLKDTLVDTGFAVIEEG